MSYYSGGSRPLVPRGRSAASSRGRGQNRTSWRSEATDSRSGYDPSHVYTVINPRYFSGGAPVLEKAKVMGSYSVDSERNFGHDQSMIHFLDSRYLPDNGKIQVSLDLNKGWDKFNRYIGNNQESFENILRWILSNKESLMDSSSQRLNLDFISARGNFTRYMRTPFNYAEHWIMYATEFGGSVYIINWTLDEELTGRERPEMDSVLKWGHIFEHYMRGGDPEEGVDANEEYRCVLKTSIDGKSMLYATEVDCADPEFFTEDFEDMEAFVLVKCCRELTEERKIRNHKKFKLNSCWADNQLSGIPRTLFGYRNDEGIVHTIEVIKTDEMPEIASGEWDPSVCLNSLAAILDFIRAKVKTDPGLAFIFEHKPRGDIYCKKLSGADHINLLPDWYTSQLFAKDEANEESD